MKNVVLRLALGALAATPTAALAHPGPHDDMSFMSGLTHPLTGIDHMLAMVTVGFLAAVLSRRSPRVLPASFILAMVVGNTLAASGVSVSLVEAGIALSIIALGISVAVRVKVSLPLAAGFVALAGFFHGAAHGLEMSAGATLLGYTAGFVVTTAVLHAAGIAIAFAVAALSAARSQNVMRVGGGAIALTGILLASSGF